MGINTILVVIACILAFLAAFGVTVRDVNLGWLAVAVYLLSLLV